MLRRLILSSVVMAMAVALAGLLSPALPVSDLPDCARFAGKDAMADFQNVLRVTYLKAVGEMGQVIYAVSDDSGSSFTCTVVDSDTLADYVSAPVISVNSAGVIIAFSRDDKTWSKFKPAAAAEFIANPVVIADYADPLPLLRNSAGSAFDAVTYQADTLSVDNSTSVSYSSISAEGTPVYYSGPSEYWGKIHCNDDIWIKQEGGGSNGGWPIFHAEVTTGGNIRYLSPNPPVEQIFRGGYQEFTPNASIGEELADQLRASGLMVGPLDEDPNRIVFVNVAGSTFSSWIGQVIDTGPDTTDVWTHYPPRSGSYLFRNRFARYDTVWTRGPSGVNPYGAIVFGQLWIKGTFSGRQVWGATGDIYIVGDISLLHTPLGGIPDSMGTNLENHSDFVALVSEQNIKIKYGYKEPGDSLRYYPNMGDTYIYASLFALGNGHGNQAEDGNISFEYQHPHPSTPAVEIDDNLWDQIDLHRHKYPQTQSQPWSSRLDYPYYNPLWPESHPYLERGTLHIYGSLYQRRQGFWHLPLNQNDNPLQVWDIEHRQYGGNSGVAVYDSILGMSLQAVNYPGTEGDGIGYRKVLQHGDRRLENMSFKGVLNGSGAKYSRYYAAYNQWYGGYGVSDKTLQRSKTAQNSRIAFNNRIVAYGQFDWAWGNNHLPEGDIRQLREYAPTRVLARHYSLDGDTLSIFNVFDDDNSCDLLWQQPTGNSLSYLLNQSQFLAVMQPDGRMYFYRYDPESGLAWELYYMWEPQIAGLNMGNIDNAESKLGFWEREDRLSAFFFIRNAGAATGTFYLAHGFLENVLHLDDNLPARLDLHVYPNPFSQSLQIRVRADKAVRATMAIYNLKGQKVAEIGDAMQLTKGENTLLWSGLDSAGKAVGSGIYFLKTEVSGKTELKKVLKIQ